MSAPDMAGRAADRVESPDVLACGNGSQTAPKLGVVSENSKTLLPAVGRVGRQRQRLSQRDMEVLQDLAKVRLLTGDQLRRLHLYSGSVATRSRRARALLQRLSQLGLVVRLARRVGGIRAGSSGFVYGLSGLGRAVLAVDGPYGAVRRRAWEIGPRLQDHMLFVAELYVELTEKSRYADLELLNFDAEPPCWRKFAGQGGQTVTLKPDAYVRLGLGDVEHSLFVEVDLATESVPTLASKAKVYAAYWRSGQEQAANGVFPKVLWLTTNQARSRQIHKALSRLPAEAQPLFEVALIAEALTILTTTKSDASTTAQGGRRG